MKDMRILALLVSITLAVGITTPAYAGGWAVVVLDAPPDNVRAGDSVSIGFTVLQHGQTPLAGLTPVVRARLSTGGDLIRAEAVPEGAVGHYTADLVFPLEGEWTWEIEAFGAAHKMPQLSVVAAVGAATVRQPSPAPILPSSATLALVAAAGGLALGLALGRGNLRARRWALAATAVAALAIGMLALPRSAASESSAGAAPSSLEEQGRQLFLAKGCITCHVNHKVDTDFETIEVGPDLTAYRNSAEFLGAWLADPNSVRPAKMPDLNLSETEILALIAFLNSN
jgi:hypothetical protein